MMSGSHDGKSSGEQAKGPGEHAEAGDAGAARRAAETGPREDRDRWGAAQPPGTEEAHDRAGSDRRRGLPDDGGLVEGED